MAFLRDVADIFKLNEQDVFGEISIVWGDRVVFVEGVERVVSILAEEICVIGKKQNVSVVGENLNIEELGGKCISISGKIQKVTKE